MDRRITKKFSDVVIRVAETTKDRRRLFQFRYEIYVREMRRAQKYANHRTRTIEEPFDQSGVNFIAEKNGEIVGCIRSNLGLDTDFGDYADLYDMNCVGPYFPRLCNVNTKFMVATEFRRTGLMIELACTAYEYVRRMGMVCDFIDCNKHLERQFIRFGYRSYKQRLQHPEYGDVLPMLLLGVDLDHLEAKRSPLAAIERRLPRQPDVVRYFHSEVFSRPTAPLSQFQQPPKNTLWPLFTTERPLEATA